MFAEIEHQRDGLDLIKINNEETKIVFTNYGARIVSWKYDDNNIVLGNVVEADEFYRENPFKFGATVGRYGGRIENGQFQLNDTTYQLEQNDGAHHLHGGTNGLDTRFFDYDIQEEANRVKIVFTTQLRSEEDGYPGDMDIQVIHTYDMEHRWSVEYKATSTERTLFNPINHVYFNLNRDNNVIDNHYLVSDKLNMYPLNKERLVQSTQPIDLTKEFHTSRIQLDDIFNCGGANICDQINQFGGLDHPFAPEEGRMTVENNNFSLEVETDTPNIVIYTLNDSKDWHSSFNIYKPHSGFTLETQCLPNDINIFGEEAKSILEAEQPFYSKTSYRITKK